MNDHLFTIVFSAHLRKGEVIDRIRSFENFCRGSGLDIFPDYKLTKTKSLGAHDEIIRTYQACFRSESQRFIGMLADLMERYLGKYKKYNKPALFVTQTVHQLALN